jgi:3-methyladenine DNA glycosylase AlkD
METFSDIRRAFRRLGDPKRAQHSQKFFRTGPGEYGEGDVFLGITVPQIRKTAKQCAKLRQADIVSLLQSPYHEERLLAALILVDRFNKGDKEQQKGVYRLYIKHKKFINSWDLVDLSAPNIVGSHLIDKDKKVKSLLYRLAVSKNLWERRMAIMATLAFIKNRHFDDTLAIAEILLDDREDLIHKAVGWMLREIGKRDLAVEEGFLKAHYHRMPRTMLRYAIEKLEENRRQQYLRNL